MSVPQLNVKENCKCIYSSVCTPHLCNIELQLLLSVVPGTEINSMCYDCVNRDHNLKKVIHTD